MTDTYTETNLYSDLRNKYYNSYESILNIPNIPKLTTTYSQIERFIRNYQMINVLSLYNKIHYITTVYKVAASDTSCIYGYLFSELNNNDPTQSNYDKQTFDHKFYIYGSTYNSQDGEYRSKFLPYEAYSKIHALYPTLLPIIEKYVLDLITEKKINLFCNIYYPSDVVINEHKFKSEILSTRMEVKLFMLCFITDYQLIMTNTQPNHMNPAYDKIFHDLPNGDQTIKHLRQAIQKISDNNLIPTTIDIKLDLFLEKCKSLNSLTTPSHSSLTYHKFPITQMGIKFIPLTVQDAKNNGNIICDTWREYYISRKISDLTLNLIAPNFPFVSSWFVIQNSDPKLFDGFSMNQKFMYSKLSEKIITSINDNRKQLQIKDDKGHDIPHAYLNSDFKELSNRLLKDIIFANTYIRLSDITLCHTSEYIGRTFLDIDKMLKMNEYYQIHDMFTNIDIFDGLMFGLLYALYTLNAKLSVSHNDLHLNNITLYQYVYIKTNNKYNFNYPILSNSHTLYHISSTENYLLKNVGFFIGIIDFSRALIGDHEIIKSFNETTYRQALQDQRNRFSYIIDRKFPKLFKDKKDQIESLLLSNLPLMFKILSGLDTYDVCIRIQTLFKNIITKYDEKILKSLIGLAIRAEKNVLKYLELALNGHIKSADDIPFPNYELLRDTYSKYLVNIDDPKFRDKVVGYTSYNDIPRDNNKLFPNTPIDENKISIIDAYNFTNKLVYSNVTNNYPPYIDFKLEVDLRKEKSLPPDPFITIYYNFVNKYVESDPFQSIITKYDNEFSEIGNSTSWLVT